MGGDRITKFVVVKQSEEQGKCESRAVIIATSHHKAYLQMLMEAEELYENYQEVETETSKKVFENKQLEKLIVLTIQEVAELNGMKE